MAGEITKLAGPLALSGTYGTNLYVPASALKYSALQHIHVVNVDTVARTFRMYLGATGATAAGTELYYNKSIAAGDTFDAYFQPGLKMTSTTFLTGGADAADKLIVTFMGREFVVPA